MSRGLDKIGWVLDPSRERSPEPGDRTPNAATCNRCGAAVIWFTTPDGRTRPFEAATHLAWDIPRDMRWGITSSRTARPRPEAPARERVCVPHIPLCPGSSVAPLHPFLQELWEANQYHSE